MVEVIGAEVGRREALEGAWAAAMGTLSVSAKFDDDDDGARESIVLPTSTSNEAPTPSQQLPQHRKYPSSAGRRGLSNDNAMFKEDFYFKFGKFPPPEVDLEVPGGMTFTPVARRYAGYNKSAERIRKGVSIYAGDLKHAIDAEDWERVGVLTAPVSKTPADSSATSSTSRSGAVTGMTTGQSVSEVPRVCGLLANQLVQSENEGTTVPNLIARCFANEVAFAIEDMARDRDRAGGDKQAMLGHWVRGRDYLNAYLALVNRVVTDKVGDKFALVE